MINISYIYICIFVGTLVSPEFRVVVMLSVISSIVVVISTVGSGAMTVVVCQCLDIIAIVTITIRYHYHDHCSCHEDCHVMFMYDNSYPTKIGI